MDFERKLDDCDPTTYIIILQKRFKSNVKSVNTPSITTSSLARGGLSDPLKKATRCRLLPQAFPTHHDVHRPPPPPNCLWYPHSSCCVANSIIPTIPFSSVLLRQPPLLQPHSCLPPEGLLQTLYPVTL